MTCKKPIVAFAGEAYQKCGRFFFYHDWIPDFIAVPVLDILNGIVNKYCNCEKCTLL